MKLHELVLTSAAVGATAGRLEKISTLAAFLGQLDAEEIPIAIGYFTGWPQQGRLGVGWSMVSSARARQPASNPALELRDVDRAFDELKSVGGKRSATERLRLLGELFARATADEQSFLTALALGEVRQGALEGVLLEAVAKAAGLPSDRVRRAVMLAGDLGTVASAVLGSEGRSEERV